MFLSWFGMVILLSMGPWSWLIPVVMAGLLVTFFRTRSWRPIVVLILSPIMLFGTFGVLSWFSLRPAFQGHGSSGYDNLDLVTRTYRSPLGGTLHEGDVLCFGSYSLALKGMCWLFGKPPRTYAGVYPSKDEAERMTHDAPPVPAKVFMSGIIPVGQQQVNIHAVQARIMLRTLLLNGGWFDDKDVLLVRAHAPSADCLVIRISCSSQIRSDGEPVDAVFLLDRQRMWPFAIYNLLPDTSLDRHPYFRYKSNVSELAESKPDFTGLLY